MSTPYRIVFCTCPDAESASRLAYGLVENRLAACVNQVPGLTSVYSWQGQIETAGEVLLIIKTRADRLAELTAFIQARHPYELPEIVAVSVEQGSLAYLDWIGAWLDSSSCSS
nr:periplasmic divalent cation tolerance protein [uncultured Gammaproteobacteria bacterium]